MNKTKRKIKNIKVGWPTGHPHQIATYISSEVIELDSYCNPNLYELIVTAVMPSIAAYLIKAGLTYKDVIVLNYEECDDTAGSTNIGSK